MTVISVIVGSTREGRFSEKPAHWILQHLKQRDGVDARLLDLRDFPMPFFDQQLTPAMPGRPPYQNEVVQRWTAAIGQSDGFVFVTPEYNYGPSAVLKNALDWVYPEWNRKAAGFVSYGSAMGARGVQQLRETMIELQLAPIRSSVHIPVPTLWAHYQGGDVDAGLAELEAPAGAMIDDLLWWTAALKTARALQEESPMTLAQAKSILPSQTRAIVQRTRGRTHGPVTRLMSPSDFGEILKPFVFLDLFDHAGPPFNGALHPHSGIATLTYVAEGAVSYIDPDDVRGTLPAGGVEWMQAGRGMWHGGGIDKAGRTRGFQLWIALPPELELGPTVSICQAPEDVQARWPGARPPGQLRVRIERHRVPLADQLPRRAPEGRRTLDLPAPAGHTVLWVAIAAGVVCDAR